MVWDGEYLRLTRIPIGIVAGSASGLPAHESVFCQKVVQIFKTNVIGIIADAFEQFLYFTQSPPVWYHIRYQNTILITLDLLNGVSDRLHHCRIYYAVAQFVHSREVRLLQHEFLSPLLEELQKEPSPAGDGAHYPTGVQQLQPALDQVTKSQVLVL
jgi:hypothetical protein